MSTALRIAHRAIGRVALFDMERSLVRVARHDGPVLRKVAAKTTSKGYAGTWCGLR